MKAACLVGRAARNEMMINICVTLGGCNLEM